MPEKMFPKKFLDFNVKLQREIKVQSLEHPKLPRKYLVLISADHVKAELHGKKNHG